MGRPAPRLPPAAWGGGNRGDSPASEETGDPRLVQAAEAAAEWGTRHQHAGLSYDRVIGSVAGFVKLCGYTRRPECPAKADDLWATFRDVRDEDLLFTESGRPAADRDLHTRFGDEGHSSPFVRPHLIPYATGIVPHLLRHRPEDERPLGHHPVVEPLCESPPSAPQSGAERVVAREPGTPEERRVSTVEGNTARSTAQGRASLGPMRRAVARRAEPQTSRHRPRSTDALTLQRVGQRQEL